MINTKVEGAAIILAFCLCIMGMASINHSEKSLAVNGKGEVLCTNLYTFSWACFITSLKLLVSYSGAHDHGNDVSPRTMRKIIWFMIFKVTLVVWGRSTSCCQYLSQCICPKKTSARYFYSIVHFFILRRWR